MSAGVAAEGHGANIVYVTDSFEITLRTGPSTDNKIISTPQSAQPLEVLEVQGDWSRVRTVKKGGEPTEGWVLSRYLIHRLPWELKSKSLSEENSSLKDRLAALQKACDEVSQSEKELAANLEENKRAFQSLQTEHESLKSGATEYLKLKAEHKVASSKLESQEKTIEEFTAQNRQLESSERNRWFATGALVLLCGLLIGVAVGRQYRKKRSSYYQNDVAFDRDSFRHGRVVSWVQVQSKTSVFLSQYTKKGRTLEPYDHLSSRPRTPCATPCAICATRRAPYILSHAL